MADHGGKVGVKVTLENHWGLTANPINIRIIVEEVNSPFCEASPDFCNWEHEYLLFQRPEGSGAVRPHQCPREVLESLERSGRAEKRPDHAGRGLHGLFALEYEDGPWDGVEGAYLYKEVLAAL